MQNPEIFKMIFSPYNTGELRYKINNMIEGVFRLIQTEKNALEITDKELDYFSAFWSSGCIAVIEKWVQKDFSPSKDHIIKKTLRNLNNKRKISLRRSLVLQGSRQNSGNSPPGLSPVFFCVLF